MNLLYAPPRIPTDAWTVELAPSADVDIERWITEQLEAAGGSPRRIAAQATATARGWPLALATFDVGGRLVVTAAYEFFDLGAAVAIGGLDPEWVRAHDLELAAALRAVDLDWASDEPMMLRDLWR